MQRGKTITLGVIAIAMLLIAITPFVKAYADNEMAISAPYSTKAASFVSAKKGSKVNIKWSKSYAKESDGQVHNISGYEIQYATKSDFSNAKTVKVSKGASSHTLYFAKLNTQRKFSESMPKYYFRMRSYYTINNKANHSSWRKTKASRTIKVYYPITVNPLKAIENSISGTATLDKGTEGYLIYLKKSGATKWNKKITATNEKKFEIKNLEYDTAYKINPIGYKTVTTTDPRSYNTTVNALQKDNTASYSIKTPVYQVGIPSIKAEYKDEKINISWSKANKADTYYIELATKKDFSDMTETSFTGKELAALVDKNDNTKYSKSISGLIEGTTYYIRMRASSLYNETVYYSLYSTSANVLFKIPTYTIAFDGNGNTSGAMSAQSVKINTDFTLPANSFKRTGYKFAGWSTKKNNVISMDPYQLGKADYKNNASVKNLAGKGKKITLYACWKGNGPVAAADWALKVAADDSFYYGLVTNSGKVSKTNSHSHCWYCKGGPKVFNCNALCAGAYQHGAGLFNSFWAGSTSPNPWVSRGFKKLGKNYDPAKIQKGDLICCYNGSNYSHIMMAASDTSVALANRKIVNARGWGKGICTQNMLNKLDNYKSYYVIRLA